jgi:hypothetical protein
MFVFSPTTSHPASVPSPLLRVAVCIPGAGVPTRPAQRATPMGTAGEGGGWACLPE